jgi:hypothetical protein
MVNRFSFLFALLVIILSTLLVGTHSLATDNKVNGVPDEIAALKEQVSSLSNSFSEQQKEITDLQNHYTSEILKQSETIASQNIEISTLKNTVAALEVQLAGLERTSKTHEGTIVGVKSELNDLKAELFNTTEKMSFISEQFGKFKGIVESQISQILKDLSQLKNPPAENPSGYTVAGKMIDVNGQPFRSGFYLRDLNGKGFGNQNLAEDGSFSLENIPNGTYKINFYFSGYQVQSPTEVVVNGKNITDLVIKLAVPTYNVSGKALATDGNPLKYTRITLTQNGNNGGYWPSTSSDGSFNLEGIAPGKYILAFGDPHNPSASREIEITSENLTNLVIQGQFAYTVSGKLVDSEGKSFYTYFYLSNGNKRFGAYGKNGEFSVPNVPNGTYKIEFGIEPYQSLLATSDEVVVNGSNIEGLEIKLNAPTYSASGKAVDKNGKPVANQVIHFYNPFNSGWGGFGGLTTNSDGTFLVTGLPNGTYLLKFGNDAHNPLAQGQVTIKNGDVAGIEIGHTLNGFKVSGKLVDSEGKAFYTAISLVDENNNSYSSRKNDEGFVFYNIPDGKYNIKFSLAPYQGLLDFPEFITVQGNDIYGLEIKINAPTYSASGMVFDKYGNAVGNQRIHIFDSVGSGWGDNLTSSPDGSFVVNGLPNGTYTLRFGSDHANPIVEGKVTISDGNVEGLVFKGL